jgi:hypothetical protein
MAATSRISPVLERPHLDRKEGDRPGELPGPLERGVQIGRADDRQPADVLLALDVRAVGRDDLPALGAHDAGGARRVQAAGEQPRTGRSCPMLQGVQVVLDLLDVAVDRGVGVGLVEAEQVARHVQHHRAARR